MIAIKSDTAMPYAPASASDVPKPTWRSGR
jgi:hypothetical protein